jgi:hypothetical protein
LQSHNKSNFPDIHISFHQLLPESLVIPPFCKTF